MFSNFFTRKKGKNNQKLKLQSIASYAKYGQDKFLAVLRARQIHIEKSANIGKYQFFCLVIRTQSIRRYLTVQSQSDSLNSTVTETGIENDGDDDESEEESDLESKNNKTIVESQANDPPQGTSRQAIEPKTDPQNENSKEHSTNNPPKVEKKDKKFPDKTKPICKFFAKGRCNKNNDCKFIHPRICRKFNQFGNKQIFIFIIHHVLISKHNLL